MAERVGSERDFVLAPNEYMFVQDRTKGGIQVNVGPTTGTLQAGSEPIAFDPASRRFVQTGDVRQAIRVFPAAPEGSYLVLENPSTEERHVNPELGGSSNFATKLDMGRKVNIPGPVTFALWPGQVATVVPGHQLRTNQYLVARVYNDETANQSAGVVKAATQTTTAGDGKSDEGTAQPPVPAPAPTAGRARLTMGKLLVIRGTDISFYIPPTGVEVVPDEKGNYTREAVTLERLEYCILLGEDGNKRYERGPAVVFPEATETFVANSEGGRKFRATELNDDMGLYLKVTADYTEEDATERKAGEELFITGREQRLYFPRKEHNLITYGGKEIHYGVAIPEGEARYVLDKRSGKVELVKGPKIFLPDPRHQVIVRRVLTDNEVQLFYPGNSRAQEYNAQLRQLVRAKGDQALEETEVRAALGSARTRGDRRIASEAAVEAFGAGSFDRGATYTPPRTITLDTKFEGAVALNVWNGYAVMVVDKTGGSRVEVGPTTVILEYDETLQVLALSKGKPKTTDELERTVYLRVLFNQVSDIVQDLVTKDMVTTSVKLSYRVNFEGDDRSRWFAVENYVKLLCDHARSLLRGAAKQNTIEEFNQNYITIIRDTILGVTGPEGVRRRGRVFEETGVRIYDVEVSQLVIGDAAIAQLLTANQTAEVRRTLEVVARERELEATRRTEAINRGILDAKAATAAHGSDLEKGTIAKRLEVTLAQSEAEAARQSRSAELEKASQALTDFVSQATLARIKAEAVQRLELDETRQNQELDRLKAEVEAHTAKLKAGTPELIAALQGFGDRDLATKLAESLSPLAILGGENVADVLQKFFKGTALEGVVSNLAIPAAAAVTARTTYRGVDGADGRDRSETR